jgi:hypothetical protein
MDAINARNAAPPSLLTGSRESEQLRYQSLNYELSLQDNQGRAVTLSLAAESLNYQHTYDRFGVVGGQHGKGPSESVIETVRRFAGDAVADQIAQQHGGVVVQHEELSLSASSLQLEVAGDMSLLEDYFSEAGTADRIFDFVSGLAARAGIEMGGEGFESFLSHAREGVQAGFEAVGAALGGLPEISQRTQTVLDRMFNQLAADPTGERPDAQLILEQLLADQAAAEEA